MDKLIFETNIGKQLIGKILGKILSNKLNTKVLIHVDEFGMEHDGEKIEFHISCLGTIPDSRKLQSLL